MRRRLVVLCHRLGARLVTFGEWWFYSTNGYMRPDDSVEYHEWLWEHDQLPQ